MSSDIQPRAHSHTGDASPCPSPTLNTTFRHHPQPPTPADAPESSLRHRASYAHESDLIRVSVQTPLGDSGHRSRRKEGYPLSRSKTVAELKDDLAAGRLEGAGFWEEDGMRLVYHGRILRDHETLGDIVGKSIDPEHVFVLHLVARRIPMTPMPLASEQAPQFPFSYQLPSHPTPTATATATLLPILPTPLDPGSVNTIALTDTIHYLLFTSRHHLFHLLDLIPLRWDDTVPPPTIPQDKAREAVMSVVRAFASQSAEKAWVGWEEAFDGDDEESVKGVWDKLGRDGLEQEIKAVWLSATSRKWAEEGSEKVEVEVDGSTYSLALPRLQQLTPPQLAHLLVYLRITALLPHLNVLLQQSLLQTPHSLAPSPTTPQPVPTPTQPLPDRRVLYRQTFRLRLPLIPSSVLSSLFFSALRISVMVYMLTAGMRSYDLRSAVIVGAAGAWWVFDAHRQIRQHAREVRARVPDIAVAAPNENQGGARGVNQAEARGVNQGAAQPAQAAGIQGRPAPRQGQGSNRGSPTTLNTLIPLFHLDTDSAQLRLPPPSLNASTFARPARSRPLRVVTQLLLPVVLWFITLVPVWESNRARSIRRRESAMRVLVNESQPRPEGDTAGNADGQGEGALERAWLLPEGLSESASKYYQRVMERGEGIDWEEEREAQRAMGVGEERDEGDEMRLRR